MKDTLSLILFGLIKLQVVDFVALPSRRQAALMKNYLFIVQNPCPLCFRTAGRNVEKQDLKLAVG